MHDRGRLLTQALLMLAGGGESCSDIEHLRAQRGLFGEVASDSTLYRVLRDIDSSTLEGVWAAVAGVRAGVWRARDGVSPGPLVLDIDCALVEVHTETTQGAAPNYKGGSGSIRCCARPTMGSRCGSSSVAATPPRTTSRITSKCSTAPSRSFWPKSLRAIAQATIRAWRFETSGCGSIRRDVRRDSRKALRDRNVGYMPAARSNEAISAAIAPTRTDPHMWRPAAKNPKQRSCRAQVAELTTNTNLNRWPTGTRLIVRR